MDFIDQLKQFSGRVLKLKDTIPTEEATKMSLIVPFFKCWGMMFLIQMNLCQSIPPM